VATALYIPAALLKHIEDLSGELRPSLLERGDYRVMVEG
jgi:hypothetical protein